MTLPSPICPSTQRLCRALKALIDAKAPALRIYVLCLVCPLNQPQRRKP